MNFSFILLLLTVFITISETFKIKNSIFIRVGTLMLKAKLEVADSASIVDGKSLTVKTPKGEVIVANVKGKYFAVDAKCPHLGKSMKIGKIGDGPSGPTITCNFHDACFSLKDGKCNKWAQNVGMVDKMKKSGPENSPATVYQCSLEKGKVFVSI